MPRQLSEYNTFVRANIAAARAQTASQKEAMSAVASLWRAKHGKASPSPRRVKKSPGAKKCTEAAKAHCHALGKVCHAGAKRRSCRKASPSKLLLQMRRIPLHHLSARRRHSPIHLSARRRHSKRHSPVHLSARRRRSPVHLATRHLKHRLHNLF